MTREIPYMPLYVERFDVDTSHLSFEEDGVYNRLLRLCWRQSGCSLPDDRCWLIRNLRTDPDTFDRVVEPILTEFFRRANGRITQKRQREEFSKAVKLQRARREAGLRGVAAKRLKNGGNGPSNGEAQVYHTSTDPQAFREGKVRKGKDRERKADAFLFSGARAREKTKIPPDAIISDWMLEHATGRGLSLPEAEAQFGRFKDHALMHGNVCADWDAAWRGWLSSPNFSLIIGAVQNGNGRSPTSGERLDAKFEALKARLAVSPHE